MSVLDKELCRQGKVRGMLGVHCHTTPYTRTTDSSHVPNDLLSPEWLLSAMRSSGLVFSKENWNPLNTRVFSPDTKTGVPIAAGALVLSGLFKCSEPQKEVTPKSLTTSCGGVSFPMYGWMVSNNLPFHPMAQCTMGTITIYRFTSSKWSVLPDDTCRMAQCCETTSPLFRSLTTLRKVLPVPNNTVNEML